MRKDDINKDSQQKIFKYIRNNFQGQNIIHSIYRPLLEYQLFCDGRSLPISQESMELFIKKHQYESGRKYIQQYVNSLSSSEVSNNFNSMSKQEQVKYLAENKLNVINSNNSFVIQIGTVVLNSDKNKFEDEQIAWQQGIKLQAKLKKQLINHNTKP